MVLVNGLTIDDINAALIALQRSRNEVVGGEKKTTVQNISVSNTNSGSGKNYDPQILQLQKDYANLKDETQMLGNQVTSVVEQQSAMQSDINSLSDLLAGMAIDNLMWDETTRTLSLYTQEDSFEVVIPTERVFLTIDNNVLTFTMGSEGDEDIQTVSVTLPYINSNEKGVANGVATLDSTGRVPYSQLPESAMEFLGEWDANTNTPTLKDGAGTNGDFYVCAIGGTANFGTVAEPRNITFYANDRVVYEGTSQQWFRLPAGEVRTVNGLSGDVVLTASNINYDSNKTIKQKIDDNAPEQANWTETNVSAKSYIKNKPNLATVATSGSYNDLSNKPTIPTQVQADWTQTNSADPSFIKNKIPVWITNGSADDNMSPIDSVTDGSMRPVTSNAVYDYKPPYAKNTSSLSKYVDCITGAGTAAKTVSLAGFTLVYGAKLLVRLGSTNTAQSALTLNVNSTGAKTIRWNGTVTSASVYAMPMGYYNCYYDGTYWNMDSDYEAKNARSAGTANVAVKARARPTFTCSTGASTVAKTISVSGYTLETRNEVLVYFSNTNTASNPTLNVNSTGAKPIKVFGTSPNNTNKLLKSGVYYCQYDGTNWNCYPYGVTNEVSANNMQSVTSNAVYNELMNLNRQKSGIIIPTPSYSRFSFIITPNFTFQITGASGKTLKFVFLNYIYDTGFTGQISWGTTDAWIQQMSGAGRTGFTFIDVNSPSTGQDNTWKTYTISIAIPSGSDIVGISCTSSIGVNDLHFE